MTRKKMFSYSWISDWGDDCKILYYIEYLDGFYRITNVSLVNDLIVDEESISVSSMCVTEFVENIKKEMIR